MGKRKCVRCTLGRKDIEFSQQALPMCGTKPSMWALFVLPHGSRNQEWEREGEQGRGGGEGIYCSGCTCMQCYLVVGCGDMGKA